MSGFELAPGQFGPGWLLPEPVSQEILAARAALRVGLATLRETLADLYTTGVRTDALHGVSRIRSRPHTNDAPTRHQPTGNTKPVGSVGGRIAGPGRQTTPTDTRDHLGGSPEATTTAGVGADVIDGPTTKIVIKPEAGTGFPSRPDPSDPANEVWTLVERAQRGETAAFGQIYDRYVDTVFRFIYFRVGNRQLAEDLTSDTFLRALKRIESFTWQGRDLGAWLVTIARNLVADHFKSGRYRLEVTTGDVLDADREDRGPEGSPESAVLDHITNVTLLTAVKQLNPEQQECIVLRFLQGFSVAETAQVMSKNEGAIKALQYRAVRALHRLLPDGFHQ